MRTGKAKTGDAVAIARLRAEVRKFENEHREISLREICRINGKYEKYISNTIADHRQIYVLKETYDTIIGMFEEYERNYQMAKYKKAEKTCSNELKDYIDDFCEYYQMSYSELSFDLGKPTNYISCMINRSKKEGINKSSFEKLKMKMENLYK